MTDLHAQLEAWLADGALGDPPREIAVHASVCEPCTATLGAFDALALIDVGAAGSPPPLTAPSRLRVGMAWARVGTAVTATVLAGIVVVFGLSQLVGFGTPASGPAGEPEGTELAGVFSASHGEAANSQEPSADDSTPGEAPTATGIPTPLPGVTPGPVPSQPPFFSTPRPPTPRPSATAAPTSTPGPTPGPTPTESPGPTAEPTPEPTAEPTPGPTPTPTPTLPLPQCSNTLDDDGDGYVDLQDPGCANNPLDDSEAPPDP